MQRIMIVGRPGSGKSSLAQAIGERTGLPVIHIDKIHWQPGWVERSKAEKTQEVAAFVAAFSANGPRGREG